MGERSSKRRKAWGSSIVTEEVVCKVDSTEALSKRWNIGLKRAQKESYPVQMVDYAIKHGLEEEPVLVWWVQYVSRKRIRIPKATKSNKFWTRTHKYGVEIPHTIEEAKATGTTLWMNIQV